MAIIKACGGIIEAHHADPIWVREHFKHDIELLRTGELPKKSEEEIAKVNELLLRIWAVWGIALLACIAYGYNPWFIAVIVIGFIFCIGATGVISGHNSGRSLWLTARNNGFRYDSDSDVTYIAQLQLMGMSLIPKELKEKAEADCRILKGHTMYRYPITYEKIHLSRRCHNWLNARISFKLVDRVRTIEVTTKDRKIVIEIAKLKKYEKYIQGMGGFTNNFEMDGRSFNKLFSSKTVYNDVGVVLDSGYRSSKKVGIKPQAFRELAIIIYPKISDNDYGDFTVYKEIEDWEIVELVDERFNPDAYRALEDDKALDKAIEAKLI